MHNRFERSARTRLPSFEMQVVRRKGSEDWPKGRSGHRMVAWGNCLFVYGGYTNIARTRHLTFKEIWKYNLTLGTWTQLNISKEGFPGHVASSSVSKIGKHLLAFGGTGFPFGGNPSNELHVVDLTTGEFNCQPTTGDSPIGSYGHGCTADEDNKKLYIVGGTTGLTFFSDVYCLDLRTKTWAHLQSENEAIPARYRHEIALYNNKLYVFGGGTASSTFDLEKIPYFDLDTLLWESAMTSSSRPLEDWTRAAFPEQRRCHSGVFVPATELSDAKYIISGGVNGDNQLDDIWSLNMRTLVWSKFKTKLPAKMYFHDAALTSSGKMVVFGGLTIGQPYRERRLNDLAVLTVFISPLAEIAWESLLHNFPRTKQLSTKILRQIGIPDSFSTRLL